jgi:hypothetical protein
MAQQEKFAIIRHDSFFHVFKYVTTKKDITFAPASCNAQIFSDESAAREECDHWNKCSSTEHVKFYVVNLTLSRKTNKMKAI